MDRQELKKMADAIFEATGKLDHELELLELDPPRGEAWKALDRIQQIALLMRDGKTL